MARHGLFTKEQLAKPYGLAPGTIDDYVACDLLHPVHLNDGVFYTSSDFLILEIILKGKRMGFSLDEVKRLIDHTRAAKTKS